MDLYRGQASIGIGNAPGITIDGGDQYLRADDDLWTAGIAKAARPWMTLDADELDRRQLEEKIEAWSYFSVPQGDRDLCFVAADQFGLMPATTDDTDDHHEHQKF